MALDDAASYGLSACPVSKKRAKTINGPGYLLSRVGQAFAELGEFLLCLQSVENVTAARAAEEYGLEAPPDDPFRPDLNVKLGTFYLGKLLKAFKGSVPVAASAYNAGPHAAQRWLGTPTERDTDLWIARIPYRETRNYVARVLGNYARYQYLSGGLPAVTPLSLELPTDADVGDDAY